MKPLVPVTEEQAGIFMSLLHEADKCKQTGDQWPGVKFLEGLKDGV